MIFSVVGFAGSSSFTGNVVGDQNQEQYTIPTIANRTLAPHEISTIISRGGVIIQSVYSKDCEECKEKDAKLKEFVKSYSGFIVMESVETRKGEGFEKFQMIGNSGRIVSLEEEDLSKDNLLRRFCSLAFVKPRECILLELDNPQPSILEGAGQANSSVS